MESGERRTAQRVAELTWRVLQVNTRMKHDGFALSLFIYGSCSDFVTLQKRRLMSDKSCYSVSAWLGENHTANNLETLEAQIAKEERRYHIH